MATDFWLLVKCDHYFFNANGWQISFGELLSAQVGQGDKMGSCRKSCAVCGVCAPGDRECYRKNREQAGYLDLDVDAEISKAFPIE